MTIKETFLKAKRDTLNEMTLQAKKEVYRNMKTGTTPDGAKMKPLSRGWIKVKGHSKPYLWKGFFYNSLRDKAIRDGNEIYIGSVGNPSRSSLAPKLNAIRPFFGLSEATGNKIINSSVASKFKI